MAVRLATVSKTEAQFEARANAALLDAMPWLDVAAVKHQLTFSFRLGRKDVPIDGAAASRRQGRLDILIEHGGQRLAILELKRPDQPLTRADIDQGLSYARVMHPRPPLVVVSNGEVTKVFATHTGEELEGGVPTAKAFSDLVTGVMKVAESDVRDAIATLMGPRSDVWMAAVRAATRATLDELTGTWADTAPTFTEGFHIPRRAAARVMDALRGPRRVVAVEGAPLIGKSHVLREVAIAADALDDMAVLLVEASGSAAAGIVDEVARLLGAAVGWRIGAAEARNWLETLGAGDGPMLVVAIDALGLEHDAIRRELEALTARTVGARLKFVVEADNSVIERMWRGETRRKDTVFARRGERVEVQPLDDREFGGALDELVQVGATFMKGAQKADEYRQPWLLRSMAASVATSPNVAKGMAAVLPPLLSLDLFQHARSIFVQDPLIEQAATFARAALDDYSRDDRPSDVVLRSLHVFMVRRAVMRAHADAADLAAMERSGVVGHVLDDANRSVLTGRVPELIASEMARQTAFELAERMGGDDADADADADAADWLVDTVARLPMGDLIGAQALFDLQSHRRGISVTFLNQLLSKRPTVRPIKAGSRAVLWVPSVGQLEFVTRADGTAVVRKPGARTGLEIPAGEVGRSYGDLSAWLMLSHLASVPIGAVAPDDDDRIIGLVHPAILALVGTSPIPLRTVPGDLERSGLHTHEAPDGSSMVCSEDGIVEPITFSLLRFLENQREDADAWIDEVCEEESAALLSRVSQALSQLSALNAEGTTAEWARARRTDKVLPALNRALGAPD